MVGEYGPGSVFINHSQEHYFSFSQRFCKIFVAYSNTTSDWLNVPYDSANLKLCYIQMLLHTKVGEQDQKTSLEWLVTTYRVFGSSCGTGSVVVSSGKALQMSRLFLRTFQMG